MKEFQARQGDVLLIRRTDKPVPGPEIPRENGRVVLAHGEVTGHAHAIAEPEVKLYGTEYGELQRLLKVGQQAPLRHEEHAKIPLDVGDFDVIRQEEYTPEGLRPVAD